MTIYSFSQIGLYEQCPKKYQYKYIDKMNSEFESSPDLILGTSVHGALERLYQNINIYKNVASEQIIEKFHEIRNNEIQKVGEDLLYKGEQTQEDYVRRGERYLLDYFVKYTPFTESKLIGTEMMMSFKLSGKSDSDFSFRGIIDRLDKEGDTFIINDYKTNKNLPPEDKSDYREQLTLYALGVKQKYGKYLKNIKARLYYLHFGIVDEWKITEEVLNPVVEKYNSLISQIETSKINYAETFHSDDSFPVKQNQYCKYCEYQNLCPLFRHQNFGEEKISYYTLGDTTIKNLVDEYSKISVELSEKMEMKNSIKKVLIKYANDHSLKQLFGTESSIIFSKDTDCMATEKNEQNHDPEDLRRLSVKINNDLSEQDFIIKH